VKVGTRHSTAQDPERRRTTLDRFGQKKAPARRSQDRRYRVAYGFCIFYV